jgi:hypothetical protein
MKLKAYKPALIVAALLAIARPVLAQDTTVVSDRQESETDSREVKKCVKLVKLNVKVGMKHLELAMNDLNRSLNSSIRNLNDIVGPEIKNIAGDINVSVNDDISDASVQNGSVSEKVKSYVKSYPMDANDKLRIDNKFGRVSINTWNKPEVRVEVNIKSYADNDQTAQKMIDAINISDNKSGDVVSFATSFGNSNSIWNELFNNRNDHHKAEVNYTVYMPSKNALDIANRYGNTEIPDMDGRITLDCSYGNIDAKALMHPDNQIHVRYGSISIDALSSADVSVSYGNFDVGSADKLNGEFRYTSARIGKIKTAVNINAHYAGGISIDELDKNFSSFSYSSNYSNLKVGVSNATNANFDVTVRYGDFSYGGLPVEITEKTPSDDSKGWKPTKNFKGHIGKGSSDRMINVSSSYGGVTFD